MRAGSSYDLFQLVESGLETPPTIAFRSGRSGSPTGSRLSNGVFTIGTVGGTAAFTARKGSRSSHIEIDIDVVQGIGDTIPSYRSSDVFRYRVEIAGIDVTSGFSGVTERLGDAGSGHYQRVSRERCGYHTAERER